MYSSREMWFCIGGLQLTSPLFGQTVALVHTLANNEIVHYVTSHSNDMYAFGTNSSELWLGSFDSTYIVQLQQARSGIFSPFFDYSGELYELSYNSGSLSSIFHNRSSIGISSVCPYQNIAFSFESQYENQ